MQVQSFKYLLRTDKLKAPLDSINARNITEQKRSSHISTLYVISHTDLWERYFKF